MMVSQQMDSISRRQDRVEQHILMLHTKDRNSGDGGNAAPQNIVINNKVEQVVQQKEADPDKDKKPSGALDQVVEGLQRFWKSPFNRALVFVGVGWGCYLITQQLNHKQRMNEMQKKI